MVYVYVYVVCNQEAQKLSSFFWYLHILLDIHQRIHNHKLCLL